MAKRRQTDEEWWEQLKKEFRLQKALRPLSDEEIRKEVEAMESSPQEALSPEAIDRIVKYAVSGGKRQ